MSVAALPSTLDTRARYGEALGRLYGRPAAWIFAFLTTASTVTLTIVSVIELGFAAKELGKSAWKAVICFLFSLLWSYLSFELASPHDEAKSVGGWPGSLVGLSVGAFAALCVAMPAFVVMKAAQDGPGLGLSGYL